ncbi:hypothetical protein RS022_01180 [Candidatus Phytoplasma rubi]|uniref:Uncharacterized protein n=1 Tax=Candidatus Phytoplasma rubi TaxID=399025 RepID=A0ABY7BTD1_9MOLU|nr:hypothetical protein RS022_01180 [Candidatus Phytoplasma rubi]
MVFFYLERNKNKKTKYKKKNKTPITTKKSKFYFYTINIFSVITKLLFYTQKLLMN